MMFHFPNFFNLDDYCEIIQNWIFQEDFEKGRLGFLLHDVDGDGMISPSDITDLQTQFSSESSYMFTFDIMLLTRQIKQKMDAAPKKNPQDISREILNQIE